MARLRLPDARDESARATSVDDVVRSECLVEHRLLDANPTEQCAERKKRERNAQPMPEHGANSYEHADRCGVERVSNKTVGARVDQLVISMDGCLLYTSDAADD